MKSGDPQHPHSEIVIVRRGGHDNNDDHHGGVWKIAYADFMTAMMALFLVMWLVNIKDEKAKAVIANYFNPIKLVDHDTSKRDVKQSDSKGDTQGSVNQKSEEESLENGRFNTGEEAKLMRDPYAGLEKIIQTHQIMQNSINKEIKSEAVGEEGSGEPRDGIEMWGSYGEPFSLNYWKQHVVSDPSLVEKGTQQEGEMQNSLASKKERGFANELVDLVKEMGDDYPVRASVDLVSEGVMIELMDQSQGEMFKIGSSVPTAEMVEIIGNVAKIIGKHEGDVIVGGHTDARPYRHSTYDNWQLSTARAQMSYYMLVRGGLDERRVLRIEGYADRKLKNQQDPFAAENRRISILVKFSESERIQEADAAVKSPAQKIPLPEGKVAP